VLIDGHLYGVSGQERREAQIRCVDFKTGKVKWSEPFTTMGSITAADGKLIALSEKGELLIAAATPDGFKSLARAQVLGGRCWTVPVLSHGRIYCRNARGDLVCLDVRPKAVADARP
jgi:outer membrane protein assembly factor BamB